jgi:hypothetical protein
MVPPVSASVRASRQSQTKNALHNHLDGFNGLHLARGVKGRRYNNAHPLGHIDRHRPDIKLGQRFCCGCFRESILGREGKHACAPDGVSQNDARAQQGGGGLPQEHFEIPSERMQVLRQKHKMHA